MLKSQLSVEKDMVCLIVSVKLRAPLHLGHVDVYGGVSKRCGGTAVVRVEIVTGMKQRIASQQRERPRYLVNAFN